MSAESKFPPVEWPPFDHSMTAVEHAKFEIYHAAEGRKRDRNDPTDIVNALILAIRPLGWQIGSMAFVRPQDEVPPPGRESTVKLFDEAIEAAQRIRQGLIDGDDADTLMIGTLSLDGDDLADALRKLADAEGEASDER